MFRLYPVYIPSLIKDGSYTGYIRVIYGSYTGYKTGQEASRSNGGAMRRLCKCCNVQSVSIDIREVLTNYKAKAQLITGAGLEMWTPGGDNAVFIHEDDLVLTFFVSKGCAAQVTKTVVA